MEFITTKRTMIVGWELTKLGISSVVAPTNNVPLDKSNKSNIIQYVASVGSGYQHQKGAKVLLTT